MNPDWPENPTQEPRTVVSARVFAEEFVDVLLT